MQRIAAVSGLAVLLLLAGGALLAGLLVDGGAQARAGIDPGAVVRDGIPVTRLVVELSLGVTLGALVLAVFALSSDRREFSRALDIAAASAAVWTVAAGASAILAFSNAANTAPNLTNAFGQALGQFLTTDPLGRAWLTTTLVGAALTVFCFAVRNVTALGVGVVLAAIGLIPLAEQGHPADASSYNAVITATWLHVLCAGIWLGGLVVLVMLRPVLTPDRMMAIIPRYGTIALVAFVVVAVSGTVSAALRVGTLPNLFTPYGVLILVKVVALVALGAVGVLARRTIIDRLPSTNPRRLFWILTTAELALMGVAEGVASALAVSSPPVDALPASPLAGTTPAEYLTGTPLPPELTPLRMVTSSNADLLWAILCVFAAICYLAGVRRVRRCGGGWPRSRTALWMAGIVILAWTTNGGPNLYAPYLFSVNMLQQLVLLVTIPVLLVLGAPLTLALDTIRPRDDGSRGVREWILAVGHSRVASVLTTPWVATGLVAASLWVFCYSPLFRWATVDHVGHEWMIVHFLFVGCLFVAALVGAGPIDHRVPSPLRLGLLVATMVLLALFGLSMASTHGLFLSDWYGAMGRQWGLPPLQDQQSSGAIVWIVGGLPTATLAATVAIQWRRSRRLDPVSAA